MTKEEIDELIVDNTRLVHFVINKHFQVYCRLISIEDKEDFVAQGYEYLIRAANNFKPELGFKFSTYAVKYIWGMLNRYKDIRTKKYNREVNNKHFGEEIQGHDSEWGTHLFDRTIEFEGYVDLYDTILKNIKTSKLKDGEFVLNKTIEGYTQTEIGRMLGITGQSVNNRLKVIRNGIRDNYLVS